MLQKLHDWYQSILPERWRGKTGVGWLMFMWLVVVIFETFWLVTGVRDPYALIGLPAFFGALTFVIGKWSLNIW